MQKITSDSEWLLCKGCKEIWDYAQNRECPRCTPEPERSYNLDDVMAQIEREWVRNE